ncbi:MAG: HmuY family protein [Bacteroidota bacterium]|nr:HmuY family protein [Bacteroidota bacterium]
MTTLKLKVLACSALMIGLFSCGKRDTNPTPTRAVTKTDSMEIPFSSSNYTFYSFKDSAIVSNSDSATSKWDFGIRFVDIIVNSHASGPGNAGVILQPGLFDNFMTAPQSSYSYDTTTSQLAINSRPFDLNSWFNYDLATHTPIVKAGQFFVFKTADNFYAKMEVLAISYAGFNGNNSPPTTLIYKFRYVYQANGTRNF